MNHARQQLQRSATKAGLCLASAAFAAGLLGGCASADRYHGPPRAEGYSAAVWAGTPADLANTRVAQDR
ncbi:MAG: hypothetical protein AAFV77_00515 [Planctomycetota bacterium]